jgi:hypothetical protein
MYIDRRFILEFFDILNTSKIQYILIKNIGRELPDKLVSGKDIDIVVHINYRTIINNLLLKNNFHHTLPPFGENQGWKFAYQLPQYQFYKKIIYPDAELYIDINFKLCCKSLSAKIWIPLDDEINSSIWKNKVWDMENNWWYMDEYNLIVYLVVRCIFDKKYFSKEYIYEIDSRRELLNNSCVISKLKKVFFLFTPTLLYLLYERKYDDIIQSYISFAEY